MPTIRPACPDDLAALLPMVQALARHHGDAAEACLDSLRRDLVGPHPWAEALVAEMQGTLVGYAILARSVQLHFGTRGMDLHHLFVAEPHRSHGIGSALIWAAMAKARAEGCARLTVGTAPPPRAAAFSPTAEFHPHTPRGVRFYMAVEAGPPYPARRRPSPSWGGAGGGGNAAKPPVGRASDRLPSLFVAKPHRTHGIVSALIWAAMAKARAEGCARLTVGTAPSLPAPQPFTQHPDFTPHSARRAVLHSR